VAFDAPGPTFRAQRYASYKSTRLRIDPDLRAQLAWNDKVVAANNFPMLPPRGFAADKNFTQRIGPDVRMVDTLRDVTYDADLVL
jgi:DNA polymerase-1